MFHYRELIQILEVKVSISTQNIANLQLQYPMASLGILFLWYTGLCKWVIIFMRNFHENIYIVFMNMNTSVQGQPSLL